MNEKEMREIVIVKINKNKSWFLEKTKKKLTSLQPDSSRKKEKRIKSTKLDMKKEKLQQTMQKYKRLEEIIMNNYMTIKWITWKKWTDSQKSSIFQD